MKTRDPGPRVLVVDDDDMIRDMMATVLTYAGYRPTVAPDGSTALDMVTTSRPDLVVLDVLMPGVDGLEVCRRLRARGDDVPIVFLTARATGRDLLEGFARGADDYVTKPFVLEELLARVRAVLSRSGRTHDVGVLRHGDLVLHESTHTVHRGGRPVDLNPTEFNLLRYLLLNTGRVVSKQQILERVWHAGGDGHVVETCISVLRRKIDRPAGSSMIRTVRGIGYALQQQPGDSPSGP